MDFDSNNTENNSDDDEEVQKKKQYSKPKTAEDWQEEYEDEMKNPCGKRGKKARAIGGALSTVAQDNREAKL
jgi:hypothetical protein